MVSTLLIWLKCLLNICIDNSSSKGGSNSSTCNLLSSRTVLIWLEIVTNEVFLFNCLHDLISSLFIFAVEEINLEARETRKVMLKLQFTLISRNELFISTQSLATIFQQASHICLLCVSFSLFCSLTKFTSQNLPLVSCLGESKFCWQSAEIRLPYHLGSYMLNDGFNWLFKHLKNVRSSQASILALNWVK